MVESQRRLYNLGVFNRVTIGPQNPNGTDTNKDVVVLVEEAKRYTLAYGADSKSSDWRAQAIRPRANCKRRCGEFWRSAS